MGRPNLYETLVKPRLSEIEEWVTTMNQEQIAEQLGVNESTFRKYKKKYPELQQAMIDGHKKLVTELKATLKQKAKGYYYIESKTVIRDEDGRRTRVVERNKKYAQPDLGSICALLKNYDPEWHNDDAKTMELKERQVALAEEKVEQSKWL